MNEQCPPGHYPLECFAIASSIVDVTGNAMGGINMGETAFVHWMSGYGWGLATVLILVTVHYMWDGK